MRQTVKTEANIGSKEFSNLVDSPICITKQVDSEVCAVALAWQPPETHLHQSTDLLATFWIIPAAPGDPKISVIARSVHQRVNNARIIPRSTN